LSLIVNRGVTATTLSSSANPSVFSQPITFAASVAAVVGAPTGIVTFAEGSTILGTAALNGNGLATLTTSALSPGTHMVTAGYSGDSNFTASNSGPLTQTVNQAPTTIAVSASLDPSVFGQPVSFTATVTELSPATGTPTGIVTFTDGSTLLGTVQLDAVGQATLATPVLTVGSHTISALYSGDANCDAISAAPVRRQQCGSSDADR